MLDRERHRPVHRRDHREEHEHRVHGDQQLLEHIRGFVVRSVLARARHLHPASQQRERGRVQQVDVDQPLHERGHRRSSRPTTTASRQLHAPCGMRSPSASSTAPNRYGGEGCAANTRAQSRSDGPFPLLVGTASAGRCQMVRFDVDRRNGLIEPLLRCVHLAVAIVSDISVDANRVGSRPRWTTWAGSIGNWPLLTRLMRGHATVYRATHGLVGHRVPGLRRRCCCSTTWAPRAARNARRRSCSRGMARTRS